MISGNLHHLLRTVWLLRWTWQQLGLRKALRASNYSAAHILMHNVGAPVSAQTDAHLQSVIRAHVNEKKNNIKKIRATTHLFLCRVSGAEYAFP